MDKWNLEQITAAIDHTILHPTATDDDVERGWHAVRNLGVAAVYVKPCYVSLAAGLLEGSASAVGTTVGFPHGGSATAVKVREAEQAMDDGAAELDMVCNVGKVLSGQWDYVAKDIGAVLETVHGRGGILKVIFENCYLTEQCKEQLCRICGDLRVDFAKTSTGFGASGATREDVKLMRRMLPAGVKVKAAGGIRTLDDFLSFREAGAERIGTSSTLDIVQEWRKRSGGRESQRE